MFDMHASMFRKIFRDREKIEISDGKIHISDELSFCVSVREVMYVKKQG